MIEDAKQVLIEYMNGRVGQRIDVDDTLFSMVRFRGFSLAMSRAALIDILDAHLDIIAVSMTSEGVIAGGNSNGTQGYKRCLNWGAVRLKHLHGWVTSYRAVKPIVTQSKPASVAKRPRTSNVKRVYRTTFNAKRVPTDVISDMARYANAKLILNDDGTVTFERSKPISQNVLERAASFGWEVIGKENDL